MCVLSIIFIRYNSLFYPTYTVCVQNITKSESWPLEHERDRLQRNKPPHSDHIPILYLSDFFASVLAFLSFTLPLTASSLSDWVGPEAIMGEGVDSDWNSSTQRSYNAHLLQKFNELLQRHKVHSHRRVVVIFFRIFSYFFRMFPRVVGRKYNGQW